MRLVFAGTPGFAATALDALIRAGHEIPLVLTQPDRAAGRGMKPGASAVKELAEARSLKIIQPITLKGDEVLATLRGVCVDAMIVAAYGLILPRSVLDMFPLGCINIHASLLPRWRGAAPIQRAVLAGDTETGISIMQMDEGLDTGPVYMMTRVQIDSRETAGSLHDKLAELGARCIVDVLEQIGAGASHTQPQSTEGVTYAHKITKEEALIDWEKSAIDLDRMVRAFNPFPGAYSRLMGQVVKVWQAEPLAEISARPGTVVSSGDSGLVVGCGDGALRLMLVQRAGGRRLAAKQFLQGLPVKSGQTFET